MQNQVEIITGHLYDGVLDPESWHAALDGMCGQLDAGVFHYFTLDTSGAQVPESAGNPERVGLGGDRMAEYEQHYADRDLRMAATLRIPMGHVMLDHEHITPRELSSDALYNDWLAPLDLRHTAAAVVRSQGTARDFLSFMRSRDGTPFSFEHKSLIERVMPHIKRAAKLRAHVGHLSRQAALGLSALDSLPQGMVVVDAQCRIEYANSAAGRLLAPPSVLRSAQGRLVCAEGANQVRLQRLVTGACASPGKAGAFECAGGVPQSSRVVLTVLPLKASHALASPRQMPMALVILGVPGALAVLDHGLVRDMLGLSPSETRLLLLVAAGKTVKDYAAIEGCSWHTARGHLKNLMRKTGCHRQLDLVQLVQTLRVG